MFISDKIIGQSVEEKKVGALALAIMIKSAYANSIIYNYSPHRHAELFGISTSLMQKNVSWLLAHGYAEIKGKHLRIKKLWNHKTLRLPFLKKVIKESTYRENIDYIRFIYFKRHVDQQEYRIERKESRQHLKHPPTSWKRHSRAQSYEEGVRETDIYNPDVTYSANTIGEILGISRGTTFRFLTKMEGRKWLARENRHELIGQLTNKQLSYLRKAFPENSFFRSKARNVYKAQANAYKIFEISPIPI